MNRWDQSGNKIQRSKCVDIPAQANCAIVTPILSNNNISLTTVACIQCKPGFIRVQSSVNFIGVNPNAPENQYELGVYYQGFDCADLGVDNYHTSNS